MDEGGFEMRAGWHRPGLHRPGLPATACKLRAEWSHSSERGLAREV
jgi:hypothetical protein